MKRALLSCGVLALSIFASHSAKAQSLQAPSGGGEYQMERVACLSPQQYEEIRARLQKNIQDLKAAGKLPANWGQQQLATARKGAVNGFIWPLQQKAGFGYNSIYGISNFVDLNASYPNQVLDWNCGSRTYDNSNGYNHAGTDIFLWPFPQYMQDQNGAEIIAAADGVIISKDDGYSDHSCSLNGQQWNAVYVGNTDGTICWYGHMKNGSQTTKSAGQSVAQGEFLGIAGSSGNSTGPHLHFEVHDGSGNVLDPYSGPCQSSASLWATQKPYSEPTVNALLTHSAPPVFPTCPTMETINAEDTFHGGDPIVYGAYFHDQDLTPVSYEVRHTATGTTNIQWTHSSPQTYFGSYWYWTRVAPSLPGEWTFNATYGGTTVSHRFYILDPSAVKSSEKSPFAARIVPNPSKGVFFVEGLSQTASNYTVRVTDLLSRTRLNQAFSNIVERIGLEISLPKGLYLVSVMDASGNATTLKLVVE